MSTPFGSKLLPLGYIHASQWDPALNDCPTSLTMTRSMLAWSSSSGAWPWHVSLKKRGKHYCAGSILNYYRIVTAAHCVEDEDVKDITIHVSQTDGPGNESVYHVDRVFIHPDFERSSLRNDIAIVWLDSIFEISDIVRRICMPPKGIDLIGQDAVATSWNMTRFPEKLNPWSKPSTISQELHLKILEHEECSLQFQHKTPTPTDTYLCAGYMGGGKHACEVDSGGPLVVRSSEGWWFLAGILSYGHSCSKPNLPGVYTRVSHYNSWIQDNGITFIRGMTFMWPRKRILEGLRSVGEKLREQHKDDLYLENEKKIQYYEQTTFRGSLYSH